MQTFSAKHFITIASGLALLGKDPAIVVGGWPTILTSLQETLRSVGLEVSFAHVERMKGELKPDGFPIDGAKFARRCAELKERIEDEIGLEFFLHLQKGQAQMYNEADTILGGDVIAKWPFLTTDIAECCKCLALSRSTACVFHLMRVMEFGVQQFGTSLGVQLVNEKVWQVILDQTNRAISNLDQKDARTKSLAAVSLNLYNVKLAWRNEVMHPKATYTEEEATEILGAVRSFLRELIVVV